MQGAAEKTADGGVKGREKQDRAGKLPVAMLKSL